MGYMGGKYVVGPHIVQQLPSVRDLVWIEPFCGALGLTYHLLATDDNLPRRLVLSDANPCVVALWQALVMDQWQPPPAAPTYKEFLVCKRSPLSRMRWRTLKGPDPVAPSDFLESDEFPRPIAPHWIGWVGLVASYRGGYLGQYEQDAQKVRGAMDTILRIAERLIKYRDRVEFRCGDFADVLDNVRDLGECVVVCDPPYLQCSGYSGVVKPFDFERFWRRWIFDTAKQVRELYVCEYLHNAVALGLARSVVWQRKSRHGWADRYQRQQPLIDCLLRITRESNIEDDDQEQNNAIECPS